MILTSFSCAQLCQGFALALLKVARSSKTKSGQPQKKGKYE